MYNCSFAKCVLTIPSCPDLPPVEELLLVLLQHSNKDTIWAACGVLMNLTSESASRPALRELGLSALLDVGVTKSLIGLKTKLFVISNIFVSSVALYLSLVSSQFLSILLHPHHQGCTLIQQALETVGISDWELSALFCKVLWNLFDEDGILDDPITIQLADTLVDLLGKLDSQDRKSVV